MAENMFFHTMEYQYHENIREDLSKTLHKFGEDMFGFLEETMDEKFVPIMGDFKALGMEIMDLDEELENPLYNVSQDIQSLCCKILDLDVPISPEEIITRALRNGPREESDFQVEQGRKGHPIREVSPNPKKGLLSESIDMLIQYVVKLYHAEGIKTNPFLMGNFAPVRQETNIPVSELKVSGQIPNTLNGMMVRNGPDPVFDHVANYSWADGDSMIHAIHFKNGNATYVSRYVRTSRFKQEQYHEKAQFLQYGDLHGEFGLFMACMQLLREQFGILDMSHGWSNANTGVVYHNEMLMILQDWDQPYVIEVLQNGDLYTQGINNYNRRLGHNVTPHPKKDPETGELFILGSSYTPPYAIFSVVSQEGDISRPLEITTSGPTYMHDFGLTQNYVIFMDLPYYYDPKKMLEKGTWIYSFSMKKSRFGILPRYATSEKGMKWFEFNETFFIFHNGNSWEEDEDTVVLIALVLEPKITRVPKENNANYDDPSHRVDNLFHTLVLDEDENLCDIFFKPPHLFGGRNTTEEEEGFTHAKMFKFTFNLRTGEAYKYQISDTHCEYPKVNESYIGRKSRYVYLSEMDDNYKITSISKLDLELEYEKKLTFGRKKYGSEVVFVPRQPFTLLAEDDGYLTTFVHDEQNEISFAYIISAEMMEPLAKIELPNRVPYGFHATFVTEEELQNALDH